MVYGEYMTEYNDGFDRGSAHGYESGYAQGRHDQLLELSEKILLRMCRCGHENADHKQVLDDGRPTSVFSCHGYGCVCGKFEEIDWDESDANHEEMMDYQRSITL